MGWCISISWKGSLKRNFTIKWRNATRMIINFLLEHFKNKKWTKNKFEVTWSYSSNLWVSWSNFLIFLNLILQLFLQTLILGRLSGGSQDNLTDQVSVLEVVGGSRAAKASSRYKGLFYLPFVPWSNNKDQRE